MLGALIGFAAGLIVGWNLLPQPEAVKALYNKVFKKT